VFKLKRFSDGYASKFKARFCVRGDLQKESVDYFEKYAPVVQWSTVRMLLTLVIREGWDTWQVDYTNAFAHAELQDEVFVEPPNMFAPGSVKDLVLKLIKLLYGLKQAPKKFYKKLSAGLLERGFVKSKHDACLFMKRGMSCVIYIDDTFFAGPDEKQIAQEIIGLGVSKFETQHKFQLRNVGEVGDFLGIRIAKQADGTFELTQTGLLDKVLRTAGMVDCNRCTTPAATTPAGTDSEGATFEEDWENSCFFGMLMYLAYTTRPDIAYSVHQAACHTHAPRASHVVAIKRILWYLKGTKTQGVVVK
jgi:hypothetical protein